MDPQPDDLTATDDLTLLQSARAGDRLAFGVLYLRHHAAAWRMACVACRFSPDAELAVIEGFTRVFSALPQESEEFEPGRVTFRPYLLACVRQAALDRARAAGRAGRDAAPAPLAGLAPDGEVILSSLEHHVARGALAALPERSRTALWLSDVEAMTPGEIAAILGGSPAEIADLTGGARAGVQAGKAAALGDNEVRAECRFTIEHLEDYDAAKLDPAEGVLVRSHLDRCPPCRMRLDELTNAPAALAAAVPAAPLLGGETQQHWLTSAAEIRPAERLLPPGVAAAAPVRRQPVPSDPIGAPGWTGSPGWSGSPAPSLPPAWTIPPGRTIAPPRPQRRRRDRRSALVVSVPALVRHARRTVWPALPAVALVVAWFAVMMALPRLMQPATAPGPDGMALPAVQAYVPGYLPGAGATGSAAAQNGSAAAGPATAVSVASAPAQPVAGTDPAGPQRIEPAINFVATTGRAVAASAGLGNAAKPTGATKPARPEPLVAPPAAAAVVAAVAPAVVPATAPVSIAAAPTPDSKPGKDTKPDKNSKRGQKLNATKPAQTSDRPQKPEKPTRKRLVPRSRIISA
jgi:DNA-directed RNA polymerase specialized sigma24 family protein